MGQFSVKNPTRTGQISVEVNTRTNVEGLPTALTLSPGEAHDRNAFDPLVAERESDPKVMLAARAYGIDDIRSELRARSAVPETPTRRNRKLQHTVNRTVYAVRNRIERFFNPFKERRRVATQYATHLRVSSDSPRW